MEEKKLKIITRFYKTALTDTGQSFLVFTAVQNILFNATTIQQICIHANRENTIYYLPVINYPLSLAYTLRIRSADILQNSEGILRDKLVQQKNKKEFIEYKFLKTDVSWLFELQNVEMIYKLIEVSFDENLKETLRQHLAKIEQKGAD